MAMTRYLASTALAFAASMSHAYADEKSTSWNVKAIGEKSFASTMLAIGYQF